MNPLFLYGHAKMEPMLRVFFVALAVLSGFGLAQPSVADMRSYIEEGFYASAARVNGPSLVEAYPDDPEAHYLYAYALYLTGNYPRARQELDTALALNPPSDDPDYELLNGLLRATEGNIEGALRSLRNAFIRSQAYDVAVAWGRVAWQAGDYETALEAYTAATTTEQGADEGWSYLNQGRMLKALGRYTEAAEAFQNAIRVFEANDLGIGQLSPGFVEAYFRLGEVFEALDDPREAKANYDAALGADPNYVPARAALDRLAGRSSP